jgi:microcystin-dependent protein
VIGTKFGAGDGNTTFNVPDFRSRHLEGASVDNAVGTHLEAGLPNITGVMGKIASSYIVGSGCFGRKAGTETYRAGGSQSENATVNFDGTNGETKIDGTLKTANEHHVYGASNTVQPDSVCVNFIIKY